MRQILRLYRDFVWGTKIKVTKLRTITLLNTTERIISYCFTFNNQTTSIS